MDPNQQQQPGQPPQPQQPVQPQPQQYTQTPQMQTPQQYAQPEQFAQPTANPVEAPKPLNFKLMGMIAGGFVLLVILLTVAITITSGSGLPLTTFESEATTFSVSLPDEWDPTSSVFGSTSIVDVVPIGISEGDNTKAIISRDSTIVDAEEFTTSVSAQLARVETTENQDQISADITNATSDNLGTDEAPTIRHTYNLQTRGQDTIYVVDTYYVYLPDGTTSISRFTYSPTYAGLGDSINSILDSFVAKTVDSTTNDYDPILESDPEPR